MTSSALIRIGTILLVAGLALWFFVPRHVTWGNHHYLGRYGAGALLILGVLLTMVGRARRS